MEGKHRNHPTPDSHNPKSEAELNMMAVFTTAHQRYTSEHSIDGDVPCDNHHQHVHNPSITTDCQVAAVIEQLRHVVSEASLLASVMVEHPSI